MSVLENLKTVLIRKGWQDKLPLYEPYFEDVRKLHQVFQPMMSVVVISWRRHPDTLQNFMKLQMQSKQYPIELILVNNGALEEEFSDLLPYVNTYIRLNTNTGAYLARNIGAAFAESPIILFLEDDGIPDDQLIESHLLVHRKYDVFSVRGVYLYKTETPLNERQSHYYLGSRFFPLAADLEGNSSYSAKVFFEVGGWDDAIRFGGGGRELALRIFKKYPDYRRQIYSPISIIYHDYASNEEHLISKLAKQKESYQRLQKVHQDWHSFAASWIRYYGDEDSLIENDKLETDFHLYFGKAAKQILLRNNERIDNYEKYRIFLYNKEKLSGLIKGRNSDTKICIFGTGSVGEKVYQGLKLHGVKADCFTDNNPDKWSQEKFGVKVIAPDELDESYLIFIASSWHFDIFNQLLGKGLQPGQHFFIMN